MNKVYLDVTKRKNCPAICINITDTEVIKAGTTVYYMDSNDKNKTYQKYANEYDIHFIFDDDTIKIHQVHVKEAISIWYKNYKFVDEFKIKTKG